MTRRVAVPLLVGQTLMADNALPLPPLFLARMEALLGQEYAAFYASYQQTPHAGLRVNTLKISPAAFAALSPFSLQPLPWSRAAFLLADEGPRPGKHPYYAAGLYYVQDPSAMAAAELLQPQPGERVLDLAAAPGGKSTHLASLMQHQGVLVSNEIHSQRVWDLAENLERWGAQNSVVLNETPARLAQHLPAFFDRVLVDAPCSGEGMFRKSDSARRDWSPELVQGCALRQGPILRQAARLVRPGGWLAYATCTFAPEENEGVVAAFLRQHPHFELVDVACQPGFAPGQPAWLAPPGPAALRRAVRLWPHTGPGEGHFVALLHYRDAAEAPPTAPTMTRTPPGRQVWAWYTEFCQKVLVEMPAADNIHQAGSFLYQTLPGAPELQGLRAIHPGRWLGVIKKNRFEPSHALAMSLPAAAVRHTLDMRADDPDVLAYLRGQTLRRSGPDGWLLVTVDGYPLGWGKRVAGVIKNHYPRGLRRA